MKGVKCFSCEKLGDVKKDCLQDPDKLLGERRQSATRDSGKPKRDFKDMKCFNSQQMDILLLIVLMMQCFVVDIKGNSAVRKVQAVCTLGLHVAGKVDGIQ